MPTTTNNYFKVAVHKFVFFDRWNKESVEKAYDEALRARAKHGGPVAVWGAVDFPGPWTKLPTVGQGGDS